MAAQLPEDPDHETRRERQARWLDTLYFAGCTLMGAVVGLLACHIIHMMQS